METEFENTIDCVDKYTIFYWDWEKCWKKNSIMAESKVDNNVSAKFLIFYIFIIMLTRNLILKQSFYLNQFA